MVFLVSKTALSQNLSDQEKVILNEISKSVGTTLPELENTLPTPQESPEPQNKKKKKKLSQ